MSCGLFPEQECLKRIPNCSPGGMLVLFARPAGELSSHKVKRWGVLKTELRNESESEMIQPVSRITGMVFSSRGLKAREEEKEQCDRGHLTVGGIQDEPSFASKSERSLRKNTREGQ